MSKSLAGHVMPADGVTLIPPTRSEPSRELIMLTAPDASPALDNDCACPDTPFSVTSAAGPGAHFIQTPGCITSDLHGGFKMVFSPLAPGGPAVLSQDAFEHWEQFKFPKHRTHPLDDRLLDQRLIQAVGAPPTISYGTATTLTVWIHVSNACNLDCPYCYVRKSSAHLQEEQVKPVVDRIIQSAQAHGFKKVKLKYAGGEASLHMRIVRALHSYTREAAQRAGLQLQAVLLSNGTALRPADVAWLASNQVKVMISLDAVGSAHDAQRPLRNGGGSFARVERTVDQLLLPQGVRPDICVTVTRLSAPHAASAVAWALERQLPISLNFYRQPPHMRSRADLAIEEQEIISGMCSAYEVVERYLPIYPVFQGLVDRAQAAAHTHTCGVGLSYLVITHKGEVAQCHMHLEHAVPDAPQTSLLPLVALGPIQNLHVDHKEGCRDCSFRYRCTGGCPLETFHATGRWDVQSPHCAIYKALIPEALRLEGLRLLKLHGRLA